MLKTLPSALEPRVFESDDVIEIKSVEVDGTWNRRYNEASKFSPHVIETKEPSAESLAKGVYYVDPNQEEKRYSPTSTSTKTTGGASTDLTSLSPSDSVSSLNLTPEDQSTRDRPELVPPLKLYILNEDYVSRVKHCLERISSYDLSPQEKLRELTTLKTCFISNLEDPNRLTDNNPIDKDYIDNFFAKIATIFQNPNTKSEVVFSGREKNSVNSLIYYVENRCSSDKKRIVSSDIPSVIVRLGPKAMEVDSGINKKRLDLLLV